MNYQLVNTLKADKELRRLTKRGDKATLSKIVQLLKELTEHPSTGTGQIEQLKYEYSGLWSRRVNLEHRIVYKINEESKIVTIYGYQGHYKE